jgi:hypothetical protein
LDDNHDKLTTMLNTGTLTFYPTTPLNFGAQVINSTSKPKTVQLSNTTNKAVSIHSIEALGPFQVGNTCGGTIIPGGTCKISATFTPLKPGPQSGTITIMDGASSKPQYVELRGIGRP